MQKIILLLLTCLMFAGCGEGQVNIPKKSVVAAEANEVYDTSGFKKINIPCNCRVISIGDHGRIVLENASGTQFVLMGQDATVPTPAEFVPDMPALWSQEKK